MWVVRNPRSDSSLFIFHFRLSGEMRRICAEARSIKDGSRNNARASADTVAGNVFLRGAKIELLRCAVSLSHIQQRTMRVMRFHRMYVFALASRLLYCVGYTCESVYLACAQLIRQSSHAQLAKQITST